VTGRYGTIGEVYYITTDYWPLNTALYVKDFKGNNPRFVSYFLRGIDFVAYSDKSAVPGVNRNHLHQAKVTVPPLPVQQRIADVLGKLDDKIELNRRMNQTLEKMAAAIFKSWFIDFLPVRAKMAAKQQDESLSACAEHADRLLPQASRDTWFVYALECDDGSLYIGQTEDLRQRWLQHTAGKGGSWTKAHPPQRVAYWERQPSREAAVEREKWLKTGFGRKWLKKEIAAIARTQTGDPVHAKAAPGNARDPTSGGLPADIADLFPDAFEDSDLGPIPKGWKASVVGDIAEQAIGGQWGSDTQKEGTVPAICLRGCDMEDLRAGGFAPKAPTRYVKANAIDKRLPSENDILIAASGAGPCGRPLWCANRINELYTHPVIYSNFVKRFTTPSPAHAVYLDRFFIRKFNDRTIHDYINGTAVPNLDASGLMSTCKLPVPPDDVLQAYFDFCQPGFKRLYAKQNMILSHLRDTLLPKLLSGEIELPEAEAIAEEAS
jgi:predicted GIY-YIG superfamily endonuclease